VSAGGAPARAPAGGLLDRLERAGNRLPDPITLFAVGALLVMALSQLAAGLGLEVEKTVARDVRAPVLDAAGAPVVDPLTKQPLTVAVLDPATGQPARELARVPVRARGLLGSEGLRFAVTSLVENFKAFPPLAIVLVGMLGIGLADRTGFLGALLKATLLGVPRGLLAPALVFVGISSSVALDAGYVVLPPIAAALYAAVGRSPAVGLGAVFAGVSAGFSANLLLTSLDAIAAGFSQAAARILDSGYVVAVTANYWFMIASTLLLTAVGWAVTSWWVEPRFAGKPPEEGGPPRRAAEPGAEAALAPEERRGLRAALAAAAAILALFAAGAFLPGAPLHGAGEGGAPRWVAAIVPLIFLGFGAPGLAYGIATGKLRSDRDVARELGETMAGMGPYVVMAFFAAQFVEYFRWSGLGEMLAIAGGGLLARAELPIPLLILGFVAVVALANLLIGSLSAKWALFAPVFVPLFMQLGVSPELTQAAYRVGDSVTNVITPLNPYVVIILVFLQRHVPRAGIGTLAALMLPYSLAFAAAWSALLLAWIGLGLPLGPAGPLLYAAPR
jgi:aminobenzoyl-glutamate transport protein